MTSTATERSIEMVDFVVDTFVLAVVILRLMVPKVMVQ